MGLDNGFILHTKSGDTVEIAYFRKYYELDRWVNQYIEPVDSNRTLFNITKENLEELERELAPTILTLDKLPMTDINYYDDCGYPEEYIRAMYGQRFDPVDSTSAFAGAKAVRLYHRVLMMLALFDLNPKDEIKLTFYSSW